jgi:hypothetical protein
MSTFYTILNKLALAHEHRETGKDVKQLVLSSVWRAVEQTIKELRPQLKARGIEVHEDWGTLHLHIMAEYPPKRTVSLYRNYSKERFGIHVTGRRWLDARFTYDRIRKDDNVHLLIVKEALERLL